MSDILPEGALIDLHITVALPAAATIEDVAEWVAVRLAAWPDHLLANNPLRDEDVMAFAPDDVRCFDTGQQGRIVEGAAPLGSVWPDVYLREPRS